MTTTNIEKELLYKNLLEKYADYVAVNEILDEMPLTSENAVLSQKKEQAIREWQSAYNSLHQKLDLRTTR